MTSWLFPEFYDVTVFFSSEIGDGDRASLYLDDEVTSSENGSVKKLGRSVSFQEQQQQQQQQQEEEEEDQSDDEEEHHPSVAELLAAAKSSKYFSQFQLSY